MITYICIWWLYRLTRWHATLDDVFMLIPHYQLPRPQHIHIYKLVRKSSWPKSQDRTDNQSIFCHFIEILIDTLQYHFDFVIKEIKIYQEILSIFLGKETSKHLKGHSGPRVGGWVTFFSEFIWQVENYFGRWKMFLANGKIILAGGKIISTHFFLNSFVGRKIE